MFAVPVPECERERDSEVEAKAEADCAADPGGDEVPGEEFNGKIQADS